MSITKHKKTVCPLCHHRIESAPTVEDHEIISQPGDFSICFYCACILIYRPDLTVREATTEEVKDLDLKMLDQLVMVQQHILAYRKKEILTSFQNHYGRNN